MHIERWRSTGFDAEISRKAINYFTRRERKKDRVLFADSREKRTRELTNPARAYVTHLL